MSTLRTKKTKWYKVSHQGDQSMDWLKWFIILLAIFSFLFMAVDGALALYNGDSIRPVYGSSVDELGSWSYLLNSLGIDPMSDLMKAIFLLCGMVGLFLTTWFALTPSRAWIPLLLINLGSAWYLWIGTGSAFVQIMLLVIWRIARQPKTTN